MAFPQSSWLASGQDRPLRGRIPWGRLFSARCRTLRGDFQEVFMGCTIYAASPKALPADEAPGQDRYYQLPHYRHPHGNCSQRIAASRARSVCTAQEVHWRHWICGTPVTTDGVNPGKSSWRLVKGPYSTWANHRGGDVEMFELSQMGCGLWKWRSKTTVTFSEYI